MGNMVARLIMLGALLTGPVFTQMLAARHMDTYKVRLQTLLPPSSLDPLQPTGVHSTSSR